MESTIGTTSKNISTATSNALSSSRPQLSHIRSLRSIHSANGAIPNIDAIHAQNAEELLAEIGYKQELKRNFSTIQVFGIAFSIMGLLPSISTTLATGLEGGPVTLLWGWFIAGCFIMGIGVCMAENSSAIPTSGGLYYWTYYYAPKSIKKGLSFVIGISNSLALAGGVCSITYGLAEQILAAAYIGTDAGFEITNGITYGVFAGCVLLECLVTCFASSAVSILQTTSIVANCGLIVLFFIALPIGTAVNKDFNDGAFIFGKFENLTDWPSGWTFFQFGMMPAVWTIGAFDSCVHMSEEAKNPTKSVPFGILSSIFVCWILGFLILIVVLACVDPELSSVIDSPAGQPLAQIFQDSLGKKWAVAFVSLTAACQFLMGASVLTAISRQVWAFARDNGLPFSGFVKVVNTRLSVPLRAVLFSAFISLLLGLLCLIGTEAANALFSIAVVGNYVSWSTPQILRVTSGRSIFKPGPFFTGRVFSLITNWVTIIFQYFIMILAMFPDSKTDVSKTTMNYAVVINCGIWILGFLFYISFKRGKYIGPISNLTDEEYLEAVDLNDLDAIDGVNNEPAIDEVLIDTNLAHTKGG